MNDKKKRGLFAPRTLAEYGTSGRTTRIFDFVSSMYTVDSAESC